MLEAWGLLLVFAFGMVSTPGPANLVLMAAGAQFGFRPCIPFILGITFGKQFVNVACFLFMSRLADGFPTAEPILRVLAVCYLLYLARRILAIRITSMDVPSDHAPGFASGLIVHPLNPKAWAMMLAAYAGYGAAFEPDGFRVLAIGSAFFLLQLVVHPIWCGFGTVIANVLQGSAYERLAGFLLAALVAVSALMLLIR